MPPLCNSNIELNLKKQGSYQGLIVDKTGVLVKKKRGGWGKYFNDK